MNMAMGDSGDPVPPEQLPAPQRIEGVGNVRFPISANAQAQMWFEQGYNLLYDFWDYEADRAFEESIRSDANCAMCYWGLYQAESFNHSVTKAYAQASLEKAVALEGHATAREKLYIQAAEAHEAAVREASGSEDKAKFDHEIEILRTLVKENPSDTNARIALSEAIDDGYDDNGEARKGKKEALASPAGCTEGGTAKLRRKPSLDTRGRSQSASGTGVTQRGDSGLACTSVRAHGAHAGTHLLPHWRLRPGPDRIRRFCPGR